MRARKAQALCREPLGPYAKTKISRVFYMEERMGFEPTVRYRTHAFQAGALNHSATSPCHISQNLNWPRAYYAEKCLCYPSCDWQGLRLIFYKKT